jgi:hypothetical protein
MTHCTMKLINRQALRSIWTTTTFGFDEEPGGYDD